MTGSPNKPNNEDYTLPGWALVLREQLSALTGQVLEIKESQDATERTLRGSNGDRGLTSRVDYIERKADEISADVKALRQDKNQSLDSGDFVSWRYIVDKVALPITLTVAGFVLTVLCPATIVLAALLPQILKLIGVQP